MLKIGSGFRTIPGPPPNGVSSTALCAPDAPSLRSSAEISNVPLSWAFPISDSVTKLFIREGKIVRISIRMVLCLEICLLEYQRRPYCL